MKSHLSILPHTMNRLGDGNETFVMNTTLTSTLQIANAYNEQQLTSNLSEPKGNIATNNGPDKLD